MGSSKSLSNIKVQNLIPEFKGMKIEDLVNDQPRRVTKYHFCRSRPKTRNHLKLVGLSR